MANSTISVNEGTEKKLDSEQLTVGANTVERPRNQIVGTTAAAIAGVLNADPGATDYGVEVRLVGQVAHDSADAGSSVKIGGKYSSAEPAVDTDVDRVDAWFNNAGALYVQPYPLITGKMRLIGDTSARSITRVVHTALSINAGGTLVAAGAASTYNYVIGMVISVTGASGNVLIEESTAGTDLFVAYLPRADAATPNVLPLEVWARPGEYLFKSAAADGIKATLASATLVGTVFYINSTANV